jgi:hypothetical protein
MGEMADYYYEQGILAELDGDYEYDDQQPSSFIPSEAKRWKTKDGTVLKISEMGTDHIHNTMKYLERTFQTSIPQYAVMTKELAKR